MWVGVGSPHLDHAGRPGAVGAVDLGVDGGVGIAGGEDAVVRVGEDGGEGLDGALPRPVEHLGLELGELVLEVGEVVGEGVDDRGVHRSVEAVVGGAQVLGTWKTKRPNLIYIYIFKETF